MPVRSTFAFVLVCMVHGKWLNRRLQGPEAATAANFMLRLADLGMVQRPMPAKVPIPGRMSGVEETSFSW